MFKLSLNLIFNFIYSFLKDNQPTSSASEDQYNSHVSKLFKNEVKNRVLTIDSSFNEDEVVGIPDGLKKNTSIHEISICEFNPAIMKAIYEGLKHNTTVEFVSLLNKKFSTPIPRISTIFKRNDFYS
jgi:hypothetical protein